MMDLLDKDFNTMVLKVYKESEYVSKSFFKYTIKIKKY